MLTLSNLFVTTITDLSTLSGTYTAFAEYRYGNICTNFNHDGTSQSFTGKVLATRRAARRDAKSIGKWPLLIAPPSACVTRAIPLRSEMPTHCLHCVTQMQHADTRSHLHTGNALTCRW